MIGTPFSTFAVEEAKVEVDCDEHRPQRESRTPPPEMLLTPLDVDEDNAPSINIDELLDQPLIDPWSPSSSVFMSQFKKLMRDDYQTAEALWAGVYCSLMVTVGMHMVHAYMDAFPAVQSCAVVYCNVAANVDVHTGLFLI